MLSLPDNLKLYPFQQKDCEFFVENGGGFCASEMGTGKTPLAVVWANNVADDHHQTLLIICPAIMRLTWEAEMSKWSNWQWQPQILEKLSDLPQETDCCIVSYRYLADATRCKKLMRLLQPTLVIFDEWHYCKSHTAKRTRNILKYVTPAAKHLLCLTGTPITRSVTDLWTQLKPFTTLGELGTYWDFCNKYAIKTDNGFGVQFVGLRNKDKLKELCRPFMKRRLKKNVLKDLPPKIFKNIYVNICAKLADRSLDFVDIAMRQIAGIESREASTDKDRYEAVATIKRELGLAKIRSTVDYVLEVLPESGSLVVFAYHKGVVDTITKSLQKKGVAVASIKGDTPPKLRKERVDYFQEGIIKVLVCNMVAGGVGITLTRSQHCVFAELDWTPANISQAMDRLHRITQKNTVQVDFMLAKNSLDQNIIGSLREKIKVAKGALGDE